MKSNFINITLGTNKWWQYGLSILSTVAAIALVNILIRQVFQSIKALFPDNDFGKSLFTFSLLLLVFGTAFIVFLFTASKLDQRAKMSFIANQSRFSWKMYFIGFMAWGVISFFAFLESSKM